MKIKLARGSGFCYGVRRAVNLTFDEVSNSKNLYTLGELIHNPQVLEILRMRGVTVAKTVEEIPEGASVVIRSHGITPQVRQALQARGFSIIDATCPKVARVQQLALRAAKKGRRVIIFGDIQHSEVKGIAAYAEQKAVVIKSISELREVVAAIPSDEKITFLAQTTQNMALWNAMKTELRKLRDDVEIFETICGATDYRQSQVRELAAEVDAVVVVGGRASGNSRRLVEVAQEQGIDAYLVETEADLQQKQLKGYQLVGLAAGASTPSWMIRRVMHALERIANRRSLKSFMLAAWQYIVRSNVLVAFGAAQILYASSRLQGIEPHIFYQLIVAAYIFAMHLLNHFTDRISTEINYPAKVGFYARNRRLLLTVGILATASSLVISYLLGAFTFLLIFALSILGMVYRVELFGRRRFGARRLMDIPGSKDIFLGLAWTAVIALLVVPASKSSFTPATAVAAVFVFSIAFSRSLVYSIRDVQGDRMVGRETIPVLLGESKTRRLGALILFAAAVFMVVSYILKWTGLISIFLIFNLAYAFVMLWLTRGEKIYSDVLFETIVESNLILTQLIAYGVHLAGIV